MSTRLGRPRLSPTEPSVNVHFRLTGSDFDATYSRARADRVTIGDWIRRAVRDAHARSTSPRRRRDAR